MATKPEALKAHSVTGLVPIKFLGLPINGDPKNRAGEAGLGLRVGEIRGVPPEVAARMIDLGTAEAVEPVTDKPEAKAAKAPAPTA